jgi:hypothetical protein
MRTGGTGFECGPAAVNFVATGSSPAGVIEQLLRGVLPGEQLVLRHNLDFGQEVRRILSRLSNARRNRATGYADLVNKLAMLGDLGQGGLAA